MLSYFQHSLGYYQIHCGIIRQLPLQEYFHSNFTLDLFTIQHLFSIQFRIQKSIVWTCSINNLVFRRKCQFNFSVFGRIRTTDGDVTLVWMTLRRRCCGRTFGHRGRSLSHCGQFWGFSNYFLSWTLIITNAYEHIVHLDSQHFSLITNHLKTLKRYKLLEGAP